MVTSARCVDFDVAITTPEGRSVLAAEYFEAHENLFEGVDEARMTKIYNSCREEIAQVARESLKEKPVERLGITGLFPICVQTAYKRVVADFNNSIPLTARSACIRVLATFNDPINCLKYKAKDKVIILAILVAIVFFYLVGCMYI